MPPALYQGSGRSEGPLLAPKGAAATCHFLINLYRPRCSVGYYLTHRRVRIAREQLSEANWFLAGGKEAILPDTTQVILKAQGITYKHKLP